MSLRSERLEEERGGDVHGELSPETGVRAEQRPDATGSRSYSQRMRRAHRIPELLRQPPLGSLLLLCLVLLVIIWSSVAIGLRAERERAEETARRETSNRAQLFEDLVLRALDHADQTLRYLGEQYLRQGRRYDLRQFAEVRLARLEPWQAITIADESGDIVLAFPPLAKPVNVRDRDNFKAHLKRDAAQPEIGAPHRGITTGKWTLPISRRITRPDGSFAGVVSIGFDPAFFAAFQDRLSLGAHSTVTLVGLDGIVRARRSGIDMPIGDDLSGLELFRRIRHASSGTYLSSGTLDGVPRYFAYRVMRDYPLVATVGMSQPVAMEGYRRIAAQSLVWAAAITVITLLFAGVAVVQARRQAQTGNALRASEARYRTFISATSGIVWTTSADGRVVEDAPSWRAYTGQSLDELRDGGWGQAVMPEDRPRVLSAWNHALRTRSVYDLECRLRGADGVYRPFGCRAVPVLGGDGEVREWIGVAEDLTARKQAERVRGLLAMIVEHASDAIVSRDMNGVIMSWNLAAERMFGYTADEAIGRNISLLREDDSAALEARNRRLLRGEHVPATEALRRTKDGRLLNVLFTAFPIKNENGAVVGAAAIVRDVTELRKTETELKLAARVYENAAEGIMITDATNAVVSVNRAYAAITGYEAADVIGRNPPILSCGEHSPAFYEELWRHVNADGRWQGEVWDRRKSGERYCALLSVSVIRDAKGEIEQHCWIFLDITARKQYENDLVRLNAELEDRVAERTRKLQHANQELSAFSYSVSHDLRAPIRAIQGYSTLLMARESAAMSAEGYARLKRVQENAEHMGQLIDDLLRLSRVSQRQLERSHFDLSRLAEEVLQRLRRAEPQRAVHATVQPGMTADGDASLVAHVMENLLGNAWKFTVRKALARIEVGMEASDGREVFYVKDNGAGFDMRYAHKLFSAFQRLHHRDEFEGTGIGLTIVQRIILKHGGTVWAQGEVGRGAAFYFTLA